MTCGKAKQAVRIVGLPEQAVENVTLENAIVYADAGITLADAEGINLIGSAITPTQGPVVQVKDCKNVRIRKMACPPGADPFLDVQGGGTNVRLIGCDLSKAKQAIHAGPGTDVRSVSVEPEPACQPRD